MIPSRRRIPIRPLALLLAALATGGCEGRAFLSGESAGATGPTATGAPDGAPARAKASPVDPLPTFVDEGVFAGDERVAPLVRGFDERVQAARKRLAVVTGLLFRSSALPRVGLAPLGDETRRWELGADVVDGRRRTRVTVNLEPLATGRRRLDATLAGALAAAAFDDRGLTETPVPAWVVRAASLAADGGLDETLLTLARRRDEDPGTVRVDPSDPAQAEPTAAAALLVLMASRDPAVLRRFFAFTADGDDADAMLSRQVEDAFGTWTSHGRERLQARLDRIDTSPWRLLARARRALEETGRAGLEAVLPETVPGEIAGDVLVLRARAALEEGDYGKARRRLASLDPYTWSHLDDPAAAAALQIVVQRGPGGDPANASRLEAVFRRDHPLAARLGVEAVAGLAPPGAREPGTPDLVQIRAEIERLLRDHRAGLARRRLAALGERASAPELAAVSARVADAETSPSPEAIEANRPRILAWRSRPGRETAQAVRDGGAAAALALLDGLPKTPGATRRQAVTLAVEAGGAGTVIRGLVPRWSTDPRLVAGDLDAALAAAAYAEVRIWAEGHAERSILAAGGESLWERLRYGLPEASVRTHPRWLEDLRSGDFPARRDAFQAVLAAGLATPGLVGHGLADPSPLLRRTAAEAAGTAGFGQLAELATEDEAWVVRQAAVPALVRTQGEEALPRLRRLYRRDPAPQVRMAAVEGLFVLAAKRPELVPELAGLLVTEESPAIREEVASRLGDWRGPVLADALLALLRQEVARPAPRTPVLSRLFLAWERATGRRTAYVAGMDVAGVRAIVRDLPPCAAGGRR